MYVIEPCCAERHVRQLRVALGSNGTREFEGYGDLSITELLPAILSRYSETWMMIVAPTLPEQATAIIERWMRRQWARMDGQGKLNVIRHLTLVTDLRKKKSPVAYQWARKNPFGERLTLVDRQQGDTVILMQDFAIIGPVNMRYGYHFTATATSNPSTVKELWEQYQEQKESGEGTAGSEKDEVSMR